MARSFVVPISSSKVENFEDVLQTLGGFGKFQVLILVLLLSLEIPTAFVMFSPIFFGASPTQWLCDGEIISAADLCSCNGTRTSEFSSIVSEWNLVCDTSWVSDFITSLQMLGMFIGNMYGGQFSDWYGRKYSFLGTVLLMILGTAVSAASPNAYVFAFARFICGAGFSGYVSISFVYSMEFMTPRWRPLSSSVGPLGEGIMILGLLAYFIRPWRTLLWATLAPFSFLIVIYPFIPESPRWLLRNQKIAEGQKVLNLIAKVNGTAEIDPEVLKGIADKERAEGCAATDKVKKLSYLEFFREKNIRRTSLCLMCVWSCWSIMYFGISFNIKNVGGSPFINVALLGLSDSVAYPTSFFVNSRIGRRKALALFMTVTALFLVSLAILYSFVEMSEFPYVVVTLCLFGKFSSAGARSSLRTFTGESYPTAIRSMGMGLIGMSACISALFAPQLAFLGSRWPSVPFYAFAVFSIFAALISFMLTETKGKPLQSEVAKKVQNSEVKVEVNYFRVTRRVSIHPIIPTE